MKLPDLDLDPLRRRALINAGVAMLISLVVGFSLLTVIHGGDHGSIAVSSPSPTTTPSKPACVPTWDIVQAADPGTGSNALHAITVISAGEAWAVGGSGETDAPTQVLLERWDGNAWTSEEGPNPGSETNELLAVDADASEPNDVWAVGRTASGFGDDPLVLRYDGTAWTEQTLPADVGGILTGVAAVAPDDVWAVGYEGDPTASLNRAIALHWDGVAWTSVDLGRSIGVGASLLSGVSATAPNDVWGVGTLHSQPLIIHFDGDTWERTPTDVRGSADAIVETRRKEVWAVGSPIQRYDGRSWSQAAGVRGGGELLSIAAVSPNDVWAVGMRASSGQTTRAIVLRYDGQRWGPVDGPSVHGSDALTAIDALDDGTVLAVGYKDVEAGRRTLAVRGSTCTG
jgi:hypothetical protein